MDDLLKRTGYSKKAIRYYKNKTNVGKIENPTISYTHIGTCGDTMRIDLKIESEIIIDAKFEAIGCAGAFSAGSALTEIIKNISIKDADRIKEENIINHLESVPDKKLDCIHLVIKTLQKTLQSLKSSKKY